jgi:hypothetical protein
MMTRDDIYRHRYLKLKQENEEMRKRLARKDTAMFLMLLTTIVAMTLLGVLK